MTRQKQNNRILACLAALAGVSLLLMACPAPIGPETPPAGGTTDTSTTSPGTDSSTPAPPPAAPAYVPITTYRRTVSLDGTWNLAQSAAATPPASYSSTAAVPGLIDTPAADGTSYYYLKQTLNPGDLAGKTVMLKINKAMYGKKLWVNGAAYDAAASESGFTSSDEHTPNYTPAWFYLSASGRLPASTLKSNQDNDFVVRLGSMITTPGAGSAQPTVTSTLGTGVNVGLDYEKFTYQSGIYDSVKLVVTGNHTVYAIQTKPTLTSVDVRVTVLNQGDAAAAIPLTVTIRESVSQTIVGQATGTTASINPGELGTAAFSAISVSGAHVWTPEDPFLYEVHVATDNDDDAQRFGLRTFSFDPVTKKPMLNGQVYMLRGTNVTMFRFFEDPTERGQLPWNKTWAKNFIKAHKDMNMNSARYSVGFPPEIWYEAADEEGFLIMDEYPIWVMNRTPQAISNSATTESVTAEVVEWMRDRNNHPSVVLWDICNETNVASTTAIMTYARSASNPFQDLQNRPWDNGWGAPFTGTDTREIHMYFNQPPVTNGISYDASIEESHIMWPSSPDWTVAGFKDLLASPGLLDWDNAASAPAYNPANQLANSQAHYRNPASVNEYAWIWTNRDGSVTPLTQATFDLVLPGASNAERLAYKARQNAIETEWFRANRHAAVQQFCGLTYNLTGAHPGNTSDNFISGGVASLTIEPLFKSLMTDAMAPLGLMVAYWKPLEAYGSSQTISVYVVNDRPTTWSGTVTLKLIKASDSSVAWTKTGNASVATGGRAKVDFSSCTMPAKTGGNPNATEAYRLVAEAVYDAKTVRSQRELTLRSAVPTWASSTAQKTFYPVSGAQDFNDPAYKMENLTDDSETTRWASKWDSTGWALVRFDLGSSKSLANLYIKWEAAYAKDFTVEVSDDPSFASKTTLYGTTGWDGAGLATYQAGLTPQTGRYVQIYCTNATTTDGTNSMFSIYEFSVW